MSDSNTFRCIECGGYIRPFGGKNRTYLLKKDLPVPIPDDFLIHTCDKCGDEYMDLETSEKLQEILEAEYEKTYAHRTK